MSALDLFQRAQVAGVTITVTPAGSLELYGPPESIRTLAPEVRINKQDLLRHFADPHLTASARMQTPAPEIVDDIPRRCWWVMDGRRTFTATFTPAITLAELRAEYPGALILKDDDDEEEAEP